MTGEAMLRQYRELLLDGIVPFWAMHGVDEEFGGVLSCMSEEGVRQSTDKYLWSQARWVWVCSALYNRVAKRPEFLAWARKTIDFLLAHGRDENGRWVYRLSREGAQLEGATSIYADLFVVYGLSEYCRAVPDAALLALAREILDRVRRRVEEPDFTETAPYALPPNRRNHGVPMILTEVTGELAETTGDAALHAAALEYAHRILRHFASEKRRCVLEFLDRDYREVPAPEGTFIMPGHAIESMWFILHRARRAGDDALARRAAEVMRWHLELGWDAEYGGIYLGADAEGHTPFFPNSDTKIWWPHTEALYGTMLAARMTGEAWCGEWFARVHEWSFQHFSMPGVGEWRQRLNRRGEPIAELIALPVKDPFHLPRALILALQLGHAF